MKNLNDDIHSISTPRFRCIISYKTFICDHQGKKFVIDHTEASIHKSRVAAQNNQTQTTFLPVANDTILQKVIFAELKMAVLSATQNISLAFNVSMSPTISQSYPDSQISLKILTGEKHPKVMNMDIYVVGTLNHYF